MVSPHLQCRGSTTPRQPMDFEMKWVLLQDLLSRYADPETLPDSPHHLVLRPALENGHLALCRWRSRTLPLRNAPDPVRRRRQTDTSGDDPTPDLPFREIQRRLLYSLYPTPQS